MRYIASFLYLIMKVMVVIMYRIFYSKITVINKDRLRFKGPGLVISNHPSTLMDPLNVGAKLPRQIFFLANAGLFKNPWVAKFLNLYCIPVERPKDVGGRRINNADNFARADKHLASSRLIYVAPEGTSVVERRIRSLKTGTARIALSAESKEAFGLGVMVLPIGLNYTAPLKFQNEVIINVGTPVYAKDYIPEYEESPFQAARKMTLNLEQQLQSLVLHTEDDAHDELLSQTQMVMQSNHPLPPKERFARSQRLLNWINNLSTEDFQAIKKIADQYFKPLEKSGLTDKSLFRQMKNRSKKSDLLRLIINFPFFLYGWINNFLAFYLPGLLARTLKLYPGYDPTVKSLAGLITIPLFYWLQTKLVIHLSGSTSIGWIYLLSLLPLGWIAWQYRKLALQFFKDKQTDRFKRNSPKPFEELTSRRTIFIASIPDNLKG